MPVLSDIADQLHFVGRRLLQAKLFSITIVLTLALGLTATCLFFTAVNDTLLRPLPYPQPDRLITFWNTPANATTTWRSPLSGPDFFDYQRRTIAFEAIGLYRPDNVDLSNGAGAVLPAVRMTPNVFSILKIAPQLGSWPDPKSEGWAVLSDHLWRTQFQADPAIVGKPVTINGERLAIAAVMPPGFRFAPPPAVAELWIALNVENVDRGSHSYPPIARMRQGILIDEATADLLRVARELEREYPNENSNVAIVVNPLQQDWTIAIQRLLWTLLGATLFVQLTVCLNAATLMLLRAVRRGHETGVRLAIGTPPGRLIRELFLESCLLGIPACALGLCLTAAALPLLHIALEELPPQSAASVWQMPVIWFAAAVTLLTCVGATLAPAWRVYFVRVTDLLRDGGRATATQQQRQVLLGIAAFQVGVSAVLLFAATLLLHNAWRVLHAPIGFPTANLVVGRVNTPRSRYPDSAALRALAQRLEAQLRTIPGVEQAAITSVVPVVDYGHNSDVIREGEEGQHRGFRTDGHAERRSVTAGYFRTLGISILQGRDFQPSDQGRNHIVVNESFANHFYPGQSALGKRIHIGDDQEPLSVIIGVSKDYRNEGLQRRTSREIYMQPEQGTYFSQLRLLVRTALPSDQIKPLMEAAVVRVDPQARLYAFNSLDSLIQRSTARERFSSTGLALFAAFAILIAGTGTYTVMAWLVQERRIEIGLRMALGLGVSHIARLVLKSSLRLSLLATATGLTIAIALAAWLLRAQLPLVDPLDPFSIGTTFAVVMAITALASWLPAREAARVSPLLALRQMDQFAVDPPSSRPTPPSRSNPTDRDRSLLLRATTDAMRDLSATNEVVERALRQCRGLLRASRATLLVAEPEAPLRFTTATGDRIAALHSPLHASFFLRSAARRAGPIPVSASAVSCRSRYLDQADLPPLALAHARAELQLLGGGASYLLIPLEARKSCSGMIVFADADDSDPAICDSIGMQFGFILESVRLAHRAAEEDKMRQEIALAARVQRRLLPPASFRTPYFSVATAILPARTVGGDSFDYFELSDGRFCLSIADVAGKGVAAALLTAAFHAMLQALARLPGMKADELASRLNEQLYRSTDPSSYITAFVAFYDPVRATLEYVNAGHVPPRLFMEYADSPSSARFSTTPTMTAIASTVATSVQLDEGGPVLGLLPGAHFHSVERQIRPGQSLFACTDGLPEAINAQSEEFGEDRLLAHFDSWPQPDPDAVCQSLFRNVQNWMGRTEAHDDLTILVCRFGALTEDGRAR